MVPEFKCSLSPPHEDQAPRRGLSSQSPARTRPSLEAEAAQSPSLLGSLTWKIMSLSLVIKKERDIFTHPQPQKTVITQSCEPLSLQASAHSRGPSHLSISSRSSRKIWVIYSTTARLPFTITPYVDNKICTNEIKHSCV